jgi:hypothetical protein
MEAITAISLACNVMQLIGFSREVIEVARQLYSAGYVDKDLSNIVEQFSVLTTSVEKALLPKATSSSSLQQLNDVARNCRNAAFKLQDEIKHLSLPPSAGANRSVVQSIRMSVKAISRKSHIMELEESMLKWQKVMDSGLLLQIWYAVFPRLIQGSGSMTQAYM